MSKDAPPIVLRPTLVSTIALLLVVGPFVAFFWFADVPEVALVIGAIGALVALLLWRRSITIDSAGITARSVFGARTLAWKDIKAYTYWSSTSARARGGDARISGPGASVLVRSHELEVRGSYTRIRIHTAYRGAPDAIARVLEILHAQLGDTATFAPFTITDAGLVHRDDTLPWSELEKVTLDSQVPPRLKVMKRDKAFAWKSEKLSSVDNGLLLLQRIAERGIPIELGPHQVAHDALVDRIATNAAIPTARVVKRV